MIVPGPFEMRYPTPDPMGPPTTPAANAPKSKKPSQQTQPERLVASLDESALTTEQKTKTFASDLLNLKCNDVFNNGHELADNQVNLRVQAYNNQNVPALKKYGSHDNTHNYLATGKPWEGANMVYRTTTFNSIVTDNSGKNSIDIDYLYFIKNADENAKIKFSSATTANSTCDGIF